MKNGCPRPPKLIGDQIGAEFDPARLENEHIQGTARPIKALGLSHAQKKTGTHRFMRVVSRGSIGLHDLPDHERRHLDHGHLAASAAARDVRVDDGDRPAIAGKGSDLADDGGRIAGMKRALDFVKVAHHPADRNMIVVVLVRGQAEYGEITAREDLIPVRTAQKFLKGKKLVLDEEHALFAQGTGKHARIRRRDHGGLIVRHGPDRFVADAAFEDAPGRVVMGRSLHALGNVDAKALDERACARDARAQGQVVIDKAQRLDARAEVTASNRTGAFSRTRE